MRSAKSVVNIMGAWVVPEICASGTCLAADASVGIHCVAPAGLFVCIHSYLKRVVK